ncbi:hypothetical protein ARMSODRAFT_976376 [Armillaria solidipes]|uniref:Uncharacterized protein n=1 Tax=Armillaria solidipes TaxID=1076256 RepID=A0A2H3BB62_9AGAR|nr:hypothetical protein ARMSODRAFT_976376 [Armillaria solidipes]
MKRKICCIFQVSACLKSINWIIQNWKSAAEGLFLLNQNLPSDKGQGTGVHTGGGTFQGHLSGTLHTEKQRQAQPECVMPERHTASQEQQEGNDKSREIPSGTQRNRNPRTLFPEITDVLLSKKKNQDLELDPTAVFGHASGWGAQWFAPKVEYVAANDEPKHWQTASKPELICGTFFDLFGACGNLDHDVKLSGKRHLITMWIKSLPESNIRAEKSHYTADVYRPD